MPKRVLLIEDEPDFHRLAVRALEREGYETTGVTNLEDAAAALGGTLPDLVVLDVGLPDGDGVSFCKKLRADARTERLPILLFTVRSELAQIQDGLEAGADDYLIKPFNPQHFVQRVSRALDKSGA